jgi:2-C-methyl-D-erythritol 2,4-cyclodiphosphate synthase
MERAFKLGYGFDSHRFLNLKEKKLLETHSQIELETEYLSKDKKLILGGVLLEENYQKDFGPFKARSDGDVIYHAVVNALLSALSDKKARDIGSLFPNTDSNNSNRNSADFIKKTVDLLLASSYELLDLKIMVKSQIRMQWSLVEKNLEAFFSSQKIFPDIHVQATSGEEMDDAGKGLGVEVFAICLLQHKTVQP